MIRACAGCQVEIERGRFCQPCLLPRRAAAAEIRRELPSLPPVFSRHLGYRLMTPDDARSLSDAEILAIRSVGPGLLTRFRASVPAPGAIANWVGEGVPALGGVTHGK